MGQVSNLPDHSLGFSRRASQCIDCMPTRLKAVLRTNRSFTPQVAREFIRIESDKNPIPHAHRGSTEIPGGADQVLFQLGVSGRTFVHVEVHDFLALGDEYVSCRSRQPQRCSGADAFLASIDLLFDRCVRLRKKLLRALAGGSAGTVIIPVDRRFAFHVL